ncbi:MAG: ATP-binding protein, partial [Nocardioidaceae bacterium]|nr:ATP-binding protein [Nocardioidaceae bacterium]
MRPTVAARLATARRRSLVGREDEVARATAFLDDAPAAVVLHVHGPGGVGKTTLLRAVEDLAVDRDRPTRWVDAAELDVSREAVLAALAGDAGDLGLLDAGTVVLLDHAEHLGAVEPWLWRELLPTLPDDCQVVVAGRRPPSQDAREPGWRDLVRLLPLRNLPATGSTALLRSRGVPESVDVTSLVRLTHGHPLALVIAADEYAGRAEDGGGAGGEASALLDHPDAAARLIGSFVDDVADPLQRQALHVVGHTRRVDRAMLEVVLKVDQQTADALLDWLRDRPYSQSHPDGLSVHDVVRDALDRDLRWRDRAAFATLHRRIRAVVLERMAHGRGAEHARAAADLLFLHRGNPDAQDLYAFEDLLSLTYRRARATDRERVVSAFDSADGPDRASHAASWFDCHPEMFHVMEDAAGASAGTVAELRLDLVGPGDDPLAARVLAELHRRRPPAPGEPILFEMVADPR